MPFLKTHASHGRFANAFYYLHYGYRSATEVASLGPATRRRDLAIDVRGVSGIVDASMPSLNKWCDQMQATYDLYAATHRAPPKGRPRTYYHFVVSPDPADSATLDDVRGLCSAWLDANFPGSEAAIIYHDDNSERESTGLPGIVHGHIIVSSILPYGEGKIQIDDRRMDELTDRLQELAPHFNMSALAHDEARSYKHKKHDPARHESPRRCGAERAIAARGGKSWKEEVRVLVSSTVPFCTDFEDLRRHLAPYGYGAERIKGGILFITPGGKKVGSNHLGLGFREYRMERFFGRRICTRIGNDPTDTFADRLRNQARAASMLDPETARLRETLDALSTIQREGIESMDGFARRREELKAFGAKERVDLAKARKAIDDAGDLLSHALNLEAYDRVYREFDALPAGPEKSAYYATHAKELAAKAKADEYLARNRLTEDDARRMMEAYSPIAERYLKLQAAAEGTAQRIEDIRHARFIAERISSSFLMRENEERAALGMPPKMPPITKTKAPPKAYAHAKTAPYWNINMKRDAYARIKATNRRARANLARLAPDKHMPPYIGMQEQRRLSMDVQKVEHEARDARRPAANRRRGKAPSGPEPPRDNPTERGRSWSSR